MFSKFTILLLFIFVTLSVIAINASPANIESSQREARNRHHHHHSFDYFDIEDGTEDVFIEKEEIIEIIDNDDFFIDEEDMK